MNKAYTGQYQAPMERIFGSTDAYKVTGKHEITVDLPKYTILFRDWVMGAMAIMPKHAYQDI